MPQEYSSGEGGNLCPDKETTFRGIHRVLKPDGREQADVGVARLISKFYSLTKNFTNVKFEK
jgi:hypothetical protein